MPAVEPRQPAATGRATQSWPFAGVLHRK